jgi:hypothetical protein
MGQLIPCALEQLINQPTMGLDDLPSASSGAVGVGELHAPRLKCTFEGFKQWWSVCDRSGQGGAVEDLIFVERHSLILFWVCGQDLNTIVGDRERMFPLGA